MYSTLSLKFQLRKTPGIDSPQKKSAAIRTNPGKMEEDHLQENVQLAVPKRLYGPHEVMRTWRNSGMTSPSALKLTT